MSGKHTRPYDRQREADLAIRLGVVAHGRHRRHDDPCCRLRELVRKLGSFGTEGSDR